MTTITYTAHAYACEWQDVDAIISGKDTPMLTHSGPEHLSESDLYLGTCTVSIDLAPKEEIATAQMARLRALLENLRAESQKRENAIIDRINKLQALTYESEAA